MKLLASYKNILVSILYLFLVIINSLPIYAQGVISVTENKNEILLPSIIQQQLLNPSANIEQIILQWFSSNGYLNAKIDKVDVNQFEVSKGCKFKLSEIILEGEIPKDISISTIEFYSKDGLQHLVEAILQDLEKKGFLFSKIEIASILPELETCEVSVVLNFDTGKQLMSEGILFPGAKSNKPEYLKRISGFRDSVLITSDFLQELKINLEVSELFEEVAIPELFFDEEDAIIVIGVQEKILNQFDGLLGYVPDQNGNGQIVGDFQLSLWNVLNQGNGMELEYQRLRPETSRLNIGVSQDWFGSIPVGLGFKFNLYQNDTTFQTRNINLDSYYVISKGLRLTGSIGQVSSTSSDDVPIILEPDGKKQYAELGFRYSTLNTIDVPTSGIRFGVSFGVSNKSVEIDSIRAFSQRFIHSEASFYIPVSNKSVLAFSTQAYFLNSDKVTENDLFWFGGANSFRGYSEEQFRASRLFWGDVEYRFLVNRSSYLFAFGALGAYHRTRLLTELDSSFEVSDFLSSTGFGISYKIKIGRLKFTYAISPEESIGNGKVHLGIVTRL
ncbi:MAG: BamA/TamA family outer membrane protein [Balneolaceae bacterium]